MIDSSSSTSRPARKKLPQSRPISSGETRQQHNNNNNNNRNSTKKLINNNNGSDRNGNEIFYDTQDEEPKSQLQEYRDKCGKIVCNEAVQKMIVILIAINAILMGVATYPIIHQNEKLSNQFETVDTIFLCIFTIELIMQFIYRGLSLFSDGWLVFDFVVILTSWMFSKFQVIRAFRIFRALRLITRVQVLRNLIKAIFSVTTRLSAIMFFLLIIFYIFAVLFTSLYKGLELEEPYFNTLHDSLFTLTEMLTLAWAETARQVMVHKPWSGILFITFIIISCFIVYNLIVAVICDAIFVVNKEDIEEHVANLQKKLDTQIEGRVLALSNELRILSERQARVQKSLEKFTQALGHFESLNCSGSFLTTTTEESNHGHSSSINNEQSSIGSGSLQSSTRRKFRATSLFSSDNSAVSGITSPTFSNRNQSS